MPRPPARFRRAQQPSPQLLLVEYALAKTWEAWGILPESVMGIGSGEITAAVLAGVISLADGARLAAAGELLALQADHVHAETGEVPIFSTHIGNWLGAQDYTIHYWSHLLEGASHGHLTEQLITAMQRIQQQPSRLLLTLGQWEAGLPQDLVQVPHIETMPVDEVLSPAWLQQTLGKLWLAGTAVSWQAVHQDEPRQRVVLPTYPFERKRYWIEAQSLASQAQPEALQKNPDITQWGYMQSWQRPPAYPPMHHPKRPNPGSSSATLKWGRCWRHG